MEKKKPEPVPRQMSKEETDLRDLGKKGRLWSIEVIFLDVGGNEIKTRHIDNQTDADLMKFRDNIFYTGLMIPMDPGHWQIFPPSAIKEIHAHKQGTFFEPKYQ